MKTMCGFQINILTKREQEIIKLLAYEYSTKEIANHLCISYETAKTHRKNIILKLAIKNVAGAIRVAFQKGIILIEENVLSLQC